MKIEIIYDQQKNITELKKINKMLGHFSKFGMYFYFPFDFKKNRDNDYLLSVISDEEKKSPTFKKRMSQLIKMTARIEKKINEFLPLNYPDLSLPKTIKCYCSFFGCYGYYRIPNEIFVNIRDKDVDFHLETIVHEIAHLFLFDKIKYYPYEKKESQVDCLVKEIMRA